MDPPWPTYRCHASHQGIHCSNFKRDFIMKVLRSLSLAAVISSSALLAWAAPDTQDAQHSAHHASGASAASTASETKSGEAAPDMSRVDAQMKSMGEMHEKMMAAKTPEERKALMAEHMKTMQDGMVMMNGMRPGASGMGAKRDMKAGMKNTMATHHQMMEKRMDMMQSMMQMTMDRMPVEVGK